MLLSLDATQIDLLIKSLYITQCVLKNKEASINLIFSDKDRDYDVIYYLQRIIGLKANEQLFNIHNNNYFIKNREIVLDKREVI